ncbi:MAG: tetratricopeptide repeat protein [Deltaproteobacteria bacterium]|nr:tetratricopeptide repeat protein [Deltaproteobacteria bacterium]
MNFDSPPGTSENPSTHWWVPVFCAVLLGCLWTMHRAAFDAPFYFDSVYHIVMKPSYHLTELSPEALTRAVWGSDTAHFPYRPLAGLTFAFTHYFGGLEPRWYRAGNVLIHWLASLALLWFLLELLSARRIIRSLGLGARARLAVALVATALWSLHPVQTNVISYVVQRMASLSGLFCLLSCAAYLRARNRPSGWSWLWVAGALASWGLGLASKENAVLVPLYFLLLEAFALEPSERRRERFVLRAIFGTAFLALGAILAFKSAFLLRKLAEMYLQRPFTIGERLLTEMVIQARYLTLLLIPDPRLLTVDAEIPISKSLLSPPTTLLCAVGIGLAVVLAVRLRRRKPLLGFAIGWFLATQLVEATVTPLELYFEHRLYLPSAAVFLVLSFAAVSLGARSRRAAVVSVCFVALFLGTEAFGTAYRTRFWANPILLYDDLVAKAPHNVRAYANLSYHLLEYNRLDEAEDALDRAERMVPDLRSSPFYENVLYNRGLIAIERGATSEAVDYLKKTAALGGVSAWRALRTLAGLYLDEGDLAAAQENVQKAFRLKPDDSWLFFLRARIELAKADPAAAQQSLSAAVRLDPLNGAAWATLGLIARAKGKEEAAEAFLRKANQCGYVLRIGTGTETRLAPARTGARLPGGP